MPRPAHSFSRTVSAVAAASAVCLLSACGADETPNGEDETPEPTAEATEGTTASPDEESPAEDDEPSEPEPFSGEEMTEILLTSGELPETPTGHSTHTGLDWFTEELAVESTAYADAFGESECASALDTINVDLVGEEAQEGLAHEYQRTTGEDDGDAEDAATETLVVWALAYPADTSRETAELWEDLAASCEDDLERGGDTISVEPLEPSDDELFTGMSLTITMSDGDDAAEIDVFSATADVGPNTVMLSAVNMDRSTFVDLLDAQEDKIQDHLAG
ncbi:hypothetical protein [Nesterenkonia sp. NBAIMH1]|uniref:hypothetical protein n=1 Tax=Nesterenkonia sp. NBAIMH1 TaxID=2600320 RepID=UPI0011B41790|nr:hypothetical protein [Nesterenkonia sp. NBAIMH1]